jgi:hypothetical protein
MWWATCEHNARWATDVLGDDDAWKTAELYMIACRVSILEQREVASPVNWAL